MDFNREKLTLDVNLGTLGVFKSAELYISEKDICLYVSHNYGGELVTKVANWVDRIDWSRFGEYIKCDNAYKEGIFSDVNLSEAQLVGFICTENDTFVFKLSALQYSYSYKTNENIAEFILNDMGYEFVQDYYSTCLDKWGDQIIVRPKRDNILAHKVFDAECFPKFCFKVINGIQCKQLDVEKVPVLEWKGFDNIESVKEYNSWICLLASLFYHQDIDYVKGVIYFNNVKIITRRLAVIRPYLKDSIFLHFNGLNRVSLFLDNVSFECFEKQKKLFKSIVNRYLESTMLSGATKYLVLYNVLEQCQEKVSIKEFEHAKDIHKKFIDLLNEVLPLVSLEEQSDFEKRWNSVWTFLKQKPYKGGLSDFLKENYIDVNRLNSYLKEEFKGKLYDFVKIRNVIAHGGNVYVSNRINDILSFVDLILILRKLKCDINVCSVLKYSDIYNCKKTDDSRN